MYCTIHVYIKKSIKIYACTCDKIYINIETYIKKPKKLRLAPSFVHVIPIESDQICRLT